MLIESRVQNYRSLRSEQVLTLEATSVSDETDRRPRKVSGHSEELLPVAALYGANASGKTNLLSAIGFMRSAVMDSHRSWEPDQVIARDPFAWAGERSNPSLFEITFLIDSVRYQYGFVAADLTFVEEWLHAWPNGKKQTWFERDEDSFKFGENLKGENKVIEQVTRPNSLFLSAAVQNRHRQLEPIFGWFKNLGLVNLSFGLRYEASNFELAELLESSHSEKHGKTLKFLDQFREMLRNADLGVIDVRVISEPDVFQAWKRFRFDLKHKNSDKDSWLPLSEESKGTQTIFRIGLPILRAIQDGSPLIVDELEASLHPVLALQIVNLFNDPVRNPKNAQLLFTTHDTNLLGSTLGESALRRDQVWFTEKDKEGATLLYPLTDYHPRKVENLERGYLQGRYGAIPFLGNFLAKE